MSVAQLESSVGPELDVAILKVERQARPRRVHEAEGRDRVRRAAEEGEERADQRLDGLRVRRRRRSTRSRTARRNLSDASDYQDASKSLPGDTLATAFAGKSAFALAAPLADKASSQAGAAAGAVNLSKLGWVAGCRHVARRRRSRSSYTSTAPPPARRRSTCGFARGRDSRRRAGRGLLRRVAQPLEPRATRRSASPGAASALAQVQKVLGVSVQDIVQAVNGPAILYVKAGAPLPEVTVVVKPADAQKAAQTVGTLHRASSRRTRSRPRRR